ncbi:MAG TPA: hypothetical protein VMY78_09860 [Solirubrobacteraceae bacterium]|nr:hypothetical protein [Solirubrobacteraceae bacterium]
MSPARAHALTPRGKALRWCTKHRGITEQPAGSNTDDRKDGIRAAQLRIGSWVVRAPWCGTWCFSALQAAGVRNLTGRMASVAMIEDDARAHRHCYRGWTRDHRHVLRGDLVVLFGRGVHVELVRKVFPLRGYVLTDGGNTSPGSGGSQANGGGSFMRKRPLSAVHGFALIDYPNQ